VNASPTLADVITFCHEGPWLEIDQRIWGLRLSGGPPWPIIPHDPDWGIGHKFWCQDGETIGYHARYKEGTWKHAAGFVRFDNSEHFQAEIDVPTHHAHSVAADRMVLDGTRESGNYLMVIERQGDRWSTPRVLCRHDSSRHGHSTHVHPRLRADGKQVCFSSDRNRYTDVYLVDIPDDLTVLPEWPGKPYRYYWE
jgi:oligogalacturonide lyase